MADMVQLLISLGADPKAKDSKGKSPGDLIGSASGTWKRGARESVPDEHDEDDLDYDPFDEDDSDLEGYATAGTSKSNAPASRADY